MDPRQRLIDEWKTVEILVAMACRRRGLSDTDADIVATMVMLKLFENDCEVVRRFRAERNAKFTTYLSRIIYNTVGEFCTRRFGKWHASAAAIRQGEIALELERLVYREQCAPDEAIARLQTAHPELTRGEIADMFAGLRVRRRPHSTVSLDNITAEVVCDASADDLLMERERLRLSERVAAVVRGFLARLPDNDRLMLQHLFESGMQMSKIARMLRIPEKPLYRRRDQLLSALRKEMIAAGITAVEVHDLIGHISDGVDFGLRNEKISPTETEQGVTAHPEIPR